MANRWIIASYLVVVMIATGQTASIHHNVTDIQIGDTVSVSIKSGGEVTALLLLLAPAGKQVRVNEGCNKTPDHQPEIIDISSIVEEELNVNMTPDAGYTTPAPVMAFTRTKPAKVTVDDILATRVTGDKTEGTFTDGIGTTTENAFKALDHTARNCLDIQAQGDKENGVYIIAPYPCCPNAFVNVYCDLETDGGGWTVIQRRDEFPHQEEFYRGWQSYVDGFGDLSREFWLGLENIHALTNQSTNEIRFDLKDFDGETRWAKYSSFFVDDSSDDYRMEVSGYSGTAKDSFTRHTGMPFATKDHQSANKCASTYKGAWWYSICHDSNLNGQYHGGQHSSYADGINWRSWKGYYYSLKGTEMKIRPIRYTYEN